MRNFFISAIVIVFSIITVLVVIAIIFNGRKKKCDNAGRLELLLFFNNINIQGGIIMAKLTLTQFLEGILKPVDRLGNPASVEPGTVQFSSSDEQVFVVEQDPTHETKLKVTAKGVGVAQLNYQADADLGEGVKTISGFTAIEVQPAEAAGFGVEFSDAQELPAPAPAPEV